MKRRREGPFWLEHRLVFLPLLVVLLKQSRKLVKVIPSGLTFSDFFKSCNPVANQSQNQPQILTQRQLPNMRGQSVFRLKLTQHKQRKQPRQHEHRHQRSRLTNQRLPNRALHPVLSRLTCVGSLFSLSRCFSSGRNYFVFPEILALPWLSISLLCCYPSLRMLP